MILVKIGVIVSPVCIESGRLTVGVGRQILQKIDPIACAGNHSILYGSIADISLFCCLRKRSASFYRCCKENIRPFADVT